MSWFGSGEPSPVPPGRPAPTRQRVYVTSPILGILDGFLKGWLPRRSVPTDRRPGGMSITPFGKGLWKAFDLPGRPHCGTAVGMSKLRALLVGAGTLLAAVPAQAQTIVGWADAGTDFATGLNWSGSVPPTGRHRPILDSVSDEPADSGVQFQCGGASILGGGGFVHVVRHGNAGRRHQ